MTRSLRGAAPRWFLLLFAAQGASLSLIASGKTPIWQHWQFARLRDLQHHGWAVAILVAQAIAVLWAMRGSWGSIVLWAKRTLRLPLALVGGLVFLLTAATPSRDFAMYGAELALAVFVQLVALGNVFVAVRSMRPASKFGIDAEPNAGFAATVERLLGSAARATPPRFLDPFAIAVAGLVLATTLVLAFIVYERVPHVPDEIAYLIHARYFAAGKLELPLPPSPAAFDLDLMYYDATRWFSPVPPGWPAILAVGVRFGMEWLVNPVISALCILLTFAVVARIDSVRSARLTALLLATSPWFLFLGMGLMTHQAALAASLAAALGVAATRERGALLPAVGAGAAIGLVGLIRPLEGLVVAVVMGLWSLGSRHPRLRVLPSAVLTLSTIATSAIVAPYDKVLTGVAGRFPIMMYSDKYYGPGANDMGFGPNRGMGWVGLDPFPGHGLRDVVVNSLLNGSAMSVELFGWLCGSLILLVAMLSARRLRALDWSMFGIILFVVGVHALYWFSGGPDFGARYWYLIIVPCAVLTARAPAVLFASDDSSRSRSTVAMLALSLGGLLLFVPWRSVEKYYHYRKMTPDGERFVKSTPLGNALVLVRGRRHPDYEETALTNPLDLRDSGTVFAWDRSRQIRADVVAKYPDRQVYVIDGPTITGGGFRVVAGPLPPGSLALQLPSSDELPAVTDVRYDGVKKRTP